MRSPRCFTPIVSAIGHETDIPLIDHAADRRASTPTDAAKLLVPDVAEELHGCAGCSTAPAALTGRIDTELHRLDALRTRPSLADPSGVLAAGNTTWRRPATGADARRSRCSHRHAPRSPRCAARSPRCHRRRPSTAATPSCNEPTARWRATPGSCQRGDHMTGRLARGRVALVVEEATT